MDRLDVVSMPKDMDGNVLNVCDRVQLTNDIGFIDRMVIQSIPPIDDGHDDDPWDIRVVESLSRDDCGWSCWTRGSRIRLLDI